MLNKIKVFLLKKEKKRLGKLIFSITIINYATVINCATVIDHQIKISISFRIQFFLQKKQKKNNKITIMYKNRSKFCYTITY